MKPLFWTALAALALTPTTALAWEPFITPNPDVEAGNEHLEEGRPAAALSRYDQAARALPNEPRVHLDRGLALLDQDEIEPAREALRLASEAGTPREVRADALYNLGLAFYRAGDAAATEENHEQAQGAFREAADAFRGSLRMRPGNADAGWNLELALRRLREQEEAQEQQEQEQQDQEDQDQQQEEQQDQDQQQEEQQDQDQQQEEQQDQDQQDQDQQDQDQQQDDGEQQPEDEPQDGQDDPEQPEDEQQPEEQEGESDPPEGEDSQPEPEPQPGNTERGRTPEEQLLDSLQESEENLERERARMRARREGRRAPEMDW